MTEKEVIVLEFKKVIFADEDDAHKIGEEIEQLSDDLIEYTGYYLDDDLKEDAEEWN